MHRRTALTVTGAIALTLAAGSAAMAANLGILDSDNGVDVGDLSPVGSSSSISTPVTFDDTPDSVPSSVSGATGTTPVTIDDDGSDVTSNTVGTTPNTVGTTTPNTIDDHGGDDDHRGPGGGDDNSGPGGDDDNSGHGGSDD